MRYLILFIVVLFPLNLLAEESGKTSITIYSKATPGSISPNMYRPVPGQNYGWGYNSGQIPGYAIVRQEREVELDSPRSRIKFSDVAALIDPTTVAFKSLTDPENTSVIEQSYHFDLVSRQKLLEKYIGLEITVEQTHGDTIETTKGKLLSSVGGITLMTEDGKVIGINSYSNIQFPSLPGGLMTKPTLMWDIATSKIGKHNIEASYQTDGITWWADYNAVFSDGKDANSGFLDLGAWVSIINKSGASYGDAKLKLIAGDVNRVTQGRTAPRMEYELKSAGMALDKVAGFAEKSFFEFHLYTLGRATDIPDNSTKQIELFQKAVSIPVKKKFIYYGATQRYYGGVNYNRTYGNNSNKKVDVYLQFKNEKEHGLGIPLPSGRLRVSKLDTDDGSLEFIGEDTIDHTPKDEELMIKLGSAFDIVGERKQLDFTVDYNRKYMRESFEITLRNHKESDVNVVVKENLYRAVNWKISDANSPYEKINSQTIEFPVRVKKDGEKKIRYTVMYTW